MSENKENMGTEVVETVDTMETAGTMLSAETVEAVRDEILNPTPEVTPDIESAGDIGEENPQEDSKPARVKYEYADYYLTCSCGTSTLIGENIDSGIYYVMMPTNEDNLTLVCSGCGTSLSLHFKDAVNPPIKDAVIVEDETEPALDGSVVSEEVINQPKEETTNDEHIPQTDKIKE